ncbi:MAG: TIGR00159 family protein [Lachnospiraceae bacterium]|nr:TIGR00159 family protein [Lachnospiraceae bacterium]
MSSIWHTLVSYIRQYFSITSISVSDIIEMLIIAFLFYEIMLWFKKTRAWALFKGIVIILVIVLAAAVLQFNTILWIASKTVGVGLIGIIIIFQPELRRALEQLGKGKLYRKILGVGRDKIRISDRDIDEILEAVRVMSDAHTGALICLEKDIGLGEYENTGIKLDSDISRQLIINIFENKTPLHDGAIIIRDDKIVAATCYLPMSENLSLNKQYGTRHRAAVGLSEVTDAMTIVVSEETGDISIAMAGELEEKVSVTDLKNRLLTYQKSGIDSGLISKIKKGAGTDEIQTVSSEVDNK